MSLHTKPLLADPGGLITTSEQALGWVQELITKVKLARVECDTERDVEKVRKAYDKLRVRQGAALGALMALYRCGKLSDLAYNKLYQEALEALVPRLIRT